MGKWYNSKGVVVYKEMAMIVVNTETVPGYEIVALGNNAKSGLMSDD